ncbi:hypothetical protein BJ138DRAFT_1116471 [Hygrophoropsis aurantiaca]|uniref:Uncharacterized protein n=1 Tax=Hygrophoropsis aurantiaca TaxID=72124 RepID=A0ACB8A3A9_9AGAM|nr:hypothetical protein BJ138DRAFT_1116471 [Hygrophoropsis aurantiaca]
MLSSISNVVLQNPSPPTHSHQVDISLTSSTDSGHGLYAQPMVGSESSPSRYDLPAGAFRGHTDSVRSVAYFKDGKHIVSGSEDKTIRICNVESGKQQGQSLEHVVGVRCISVSPDARTLVVSGDSGVGLWNLESGRVVWTDAEEVDGYGVVFSPDGQLIAATANKDIVLLDAKTGERIRESLQFSEHVSCLAFSPDGARPIAGSRQGARVFDVATGKTILGPFDTYSRAVSSLVFTPDGKQIITALDNGFIQVWDGSTGQEASKPTQMLRSQLGGTKPGGIKEIAPSRDGRRLASVCTYSDMVFLWDLSTRQRLGKSLHSPQADPQGSFLGRPNTLFSVSWSPDGQSLVAGGDIGKIYQWEVPPLEDEDTGTCPILVPSNPLLPTTPQSSTSSLSSSLLDMPAGALPPNRLNSNPPPLPDDFWDCSDSIPAAKLPPVSLIPGTSLTSVNQRPLEFATSRKPFMDGQQRRALRILPKAIQDLANKAIQGSTADLQILYESITDTEPNTSRLSALLPVFFLHLDPALIPSSGKKKYTADELGVIHRARWALKAVGKILDRIPPKDGDSADWERMFPWMLFLQTKFLLPDPSRDEQLGISFPDGDIAQTMVQDFSVICYSGELNLGMIQSTPGATHLIAVLWLFVAHQHVDYGELQGAHAQKAALLLQGAITLVALSNICPEAPEGMATLLHAAGTVNRVLATAVRYVRLIADTVRRMKDPTLDNLAVVDVAANALADCVSFIESFERCDPAHSHALVALGSVQSVTTATRHISRLLLADSRANAYVRDCDRRSGHTPTQRLENLTKAYQYLHFAIFHLADGVTPACHALNAGVLEAIFCTWLYTSSSCTSHPRPKFAENEAIIVLWRVIPCYFVYSRVLHALAKALKHPSFCEVELLARQDDDLWGLWETLGATAREYIARGSGAGMGGDGLHARRCAADNASRLPALYFYGIVDERGSVRVPVCIVMTIVKMVVRMKVTAKVKVKSRRRRTSAVRGVLLARTVPRRVSVQTGRRAIGWGVESCVMATLTSHNLRRSLPLISVIEGIEWAKNREGIRRAYQGYIRSQANKGQGQAEHIAVEIDLANYPRNISVVKLDIEWYCRSAASGSGAGSRLDSGSDKVRLRLQRAHEEWAEVLAAMRRRGGMDLLTVIKIWDGRDHEIRSILSPGAALKVFCARRG